MADSKSMIDDIRYGQCEPLHETILLLDWYFFQIHRPSLASAEGAVRQCERLQRCVQPQLLRARLTKRVTARGENGAARRMRCEAYLAGAREYGSGTAKKFDKVLKISLHVFFFRSNEFRESFCYTTAFNHRIGIEEAWISSYTIGDYAQKSWKLTRCI